MLGLGKEHQPEGRRAGGDHGGSSRTAARPRGRHVRLDDAITYFLGQWPAEGPGRGTIETYSRQLKWLSQFATERRKPMLADLTPDLLRAAMASKFANKSGSRTFKGGEASAQSLAFAARRMAKWLRAQGVPVADLAIVKPRRPPERVQPRLQLHEFDALEQAILRRLVDFNRHVPRASVARDLALIHLLAETGLRASEVVGMDVGSVDFDVGAVMVIRRGIGKSRKERALSIVDPDDLYRGAALRLLAEWIEIRASIRKANEHRSLWTSMKGNPFTTGELRRVLRKICQAAGLPENRPPHAFRRMNFTESYRANPAAIRVLADRMGWSPRNDQMISIYTRGATIDLARTTPVPSIVGRWRNDSPNVLITNRASKPILGRGVGPPSGARVNGPALPNLGGRDRAQTASQAPRRRPTPLS